MKEEKVKMDKEKYVTPQALAVPSIRLRRYSQDLIPFDKSVAAAESDQRSSKLPGKETLNVIFYQVFIPLLIAGFDTVGTGFLLDHVQHWPVVVEIPELFILVTSFVGLKGSLEMTLAARLGTFANSGEMNTRKDRWNIYVGNCFLVQGQAIVVAFMGSIIAIIVHYLKESCVSWSDYLLMMTSGLIAASITGVAMVTVMVILTIIVMKMGMNPDNVSSFSASIAGDVSAVAVMILCGNKFFYDRQLLHYLGPCVVIFYLILLPITLLLAAKNSSTRDVVGTGWFPIIIGLIISSVAGVVFDIATEHFSTIAIYTPIINGVGGCLIAVQSSRISTYFHLRSPLGELPCEPSKKRSLPTIIESSQKDEQLVEKCYRKTIPSPITAFVGEHVNVRTARLLLLMAIPIHLVYFMTVYYVHPESSNSLSFSFLSSYILVIVIQVSCLLYAAHFLVPYLWKTKLNPDNVAVPPLMALADLLGTLLLTSAYFLLSLINDPAVAPHNPNTFHSVLH